MKLNNCCICCSLKTGTITLGILSLIGCLYSLISSFNELSHGGYGIFLICLYIVSACTAILVIIGAVKGKHGFIIPYLIIGVLSIIVSFITGLIIFISDKNDVYPDEMTQNLKNNLAISIILFIIVLCLQVYFWLVPYSYYKELKQGVPTNQNGVVYP